MEVQKTLRYRAAWGCPPENPEIQGPAGMAKAIPMPDPPLSPAHAATLSAWFLFLPGQAPGWNCYQLTVIHLRDIEGVPPAAILIPGAEYEFVLTGLDPRPGPSPLDPATLLYLEPATVRVQFGGVSDAQAASLGRRAATGLVFGHLLAETGITIRGGIDDHLNTSWANAIALTLEEMLSPEKAPQDQPPAAASRDLPTLAARPYAPAVRPLFDKRSLN